MSKRKSDIHIDREVDDHDDDGQEEVVKITVEEAKSRENTEEFLICKANERGGEEENLANRICSRRIVQQKKIRHRIFWIYYNCSFVSPALGGCE